MGRIGNIINRKGKQDAKRASVFTKHARAITVAAKEGALCHAAVQMVGRLVQNQQICRT